VYCTPDRKVRAPTRLCSAGHGRCRLQTFWALGALHNALGHFCCAAFDTKGSFKLRSAAKLLPSHPRRVACARLAAQTLQAKQFASNGVHINNDAHSEYSVVVIAEVRRKLVCRGGVRSHAGS